MSLCPCQGPAGLMGTALWLRCASAGTQPGVSGLNGALGPSFIPATLGCKSKGRVEQGWVFVPRAGGIHGCAPCQPCPSKGGRGWSIPPGQGHQDRLMGSATQTSVCSHLPVPLLTPPSPPILESARAEPSCSCSIPRLWRLVSLDKAAETGMNPCRGSSCCSPGCSQPREMAERCCGSAGMGQIEPCHHAQQPGTGTPQCSQGLAVVASEGCSQRAQGGHRASKAASVQISWINPGQTWRPGKPSQIQLADCVSEDR